MEILPGEFSRDYDKTALMNAWLDIIHLGEVSMASAKGNPICAVRRAQQTCG